jgi:hypothetical protein
VINTMESQSMTIHGLQVKIFEGMHNVENRIFKATTKNGDHLVQTYGRVMGHGLQMPLKKAPYYTITSQSQGIHPTP